MKIITRLLMIVAFIAFFAVIALGYINQISWVGVSNLNPNPNIKTLWDWMQLLIIPVILALGGWWLASSERKAEIEKARLQKETEIQITLEKQRQDALQAYLDYMTTLILDRNLREASSDSDIAAIATARTHATLRMLDSVRKGILIRFLVEAGLITNTEVVDEEIVDCLPVLELEGADLRGVELTDVTFWRGLVLHGANLSDALLERISFGRSDLWGFKADKANFSFCELMGANLAHANISNSNFFHINASDIIFGWSKIKGSDFTGALLVKSGFDRTNLKDVIFTESWFRGADFTEATLERVSFEDADLSPWYKKDQKKASTFNGAKLTDVKFNGADLTEVDFRNATVSLDQLAKAKSLKGMIMPNGDIHQ